MHVFKLNIGSLFSPVKGGGFVDVEPLTSGNGIIKYRDDEDFYRVRKKLKGNLVFKGDEYRALKILKDNEEKNIDIQIYNQDQLKVSGYLVFEGDWDDNKHICSLMVQVIDQYSDFDKNLDFETNILNQIKNTVYITQTSKLYQITLPCFIGQAVEAQLYYDPDGNVSADPFSPHPDWAYFTLTNTQSGGGCQIYTFDTYYLTEAFTGWTQSQIWEERYLKKETSPSVIKEPLTRAIKLYDVLDQLLDDADSTIQISESTYSDYINDVANNIYNLFILDKSDAKRPTSSDPATYQVIKLSELLDVYNKFFNLFYEIDEDFNFKLKFITELTEPNYTTYPANDQTTYKGVNITNNQLFYSTKIDNKTDKETLQLEFDGSIIDYELYFENSKTYDFQNFNNDVSYLITNPDIANDDGFCMVACDSSNNILNETISGTEFANVSMLSQGLMENHFINANRPFSKGKLNTNAITLVKKKDKEIIYKNCLVDDIDLINFNYLVKTDLGLCVPYEIEIPFQKDFSTLKIRL